MFSFVFVASFLRGLVIHEKRKSLFLAQIKLKPCIAGQSRKDAALAKPLDAEVILWLKDHSNRDHPEILKMHARFINRYPSGKILKQ